jgi:hypothetical protein
MAADALERERERDRVADRQPNDPDCRGTETCLLGRGDFVAVAVESEL